MSDYIPERREAWTRPHPEDGREQTAIVEVQSRYGLELVEVSYDLLAWMLTELGYTREETP